MPQIDFDIDAVELDTPMKFELLPAGKYLVAAISSDLRKTKLGTGENLTYVFDVMEGPSKGRRLWDNFNVKNDREDVQRSGHAKLAVFAIACGRLNGIVVESSELHDIPVYATVGIEEAKNGYGPKNFIRGFSAPGATSVAVLRPAVSAPRAESSAPTRPAWKRG